MGGSCKRALTGAAVGGKSAGGGGFRISPSAVVSTRHVQACRLASGKFLWTGGV